MNYIKNGHTQYGDYKGEASLDFPGVHPTLESLAADIGVDIHKNRPVGLEITYMDSGSGKFNCSIFTVENSKEQSVTNVYFVTEIKFEMEYVKLLEYFKDLFITLTEPNDGTIRYEIVKSRHIDDTKTNE